MNNVNIAILTSLNELAVRYEVQPWEFIATVREGDRGTQLRFEAPAGPGSANQYRKMLAAIGINADADVHDLVGEDGAIYSTIRKAIDLAPRPRPKR